MVKCSVWKKLSTVLILIGSCLTGCSTLQPSSESQPTMVQQIMPEGELIARGFKNTRKNELYNVESLIGFFQKIDDRINRKVRIVQIGDSHIRGHIFPAVLRQNLAEKWGSDAMANQKIDYYTSALAEETGKDGFIFHAIGKNGATIAYFMKPKQLDEIAKLQPDLIIISVGTNESHMVFNAEVYGQKLDQFISEMKMRMAKQGNEVAFLLTTPPCSHLSNIKTEEYIGEDGQLHSKKTKIKIANPVTSDVAQFQYAYAEKHGIALWNLYEIAGGKESACSNWWTGEFMAKDGIHYTKRGYTIQAKLLGSALLNAYFDYKKSQEKIR